MRRQSKLIIAFSFLCAAALAASRAAELEMPSLEYPDAASPPSPRPEHPCPRERLLLESPAMREGGEAPNIEPAQLDPMDESLPINLPTALYLSNARPLIVAFAQASVEESAARLQKAGVLWLPDLNFAGNYYRHDGTLIRSPGNVISANKSTLMAGAGATLDFAVTDAIFRPLADRQELSARRSELQAARNDALLSVAVAYFDVQQARGVLAGTLDAAGKAEILVRKTEGLAVGLVPKMEIDRTETLLLDLRQRAAAARGNWRIASSRLTRVLRLNPFAVVVPTEPAHLQIDLFSPGISGNSLISVGLANRPEIAAQRALVQASVERVRQEELRPFIPSVIVQGDNGFGARNSVLGSIFGGGIDGTPQVFGGRFDVNVTAVWTLNNLGAGNRAMVRERCAQQITATIDFANLQDQVAQEVVQSLAQLDVAARQICDASTAVRTAAITFQGSLTGLGQTQRDGELLHLVARPIEAVAALEQLNRAYEEYYAVVNAYNRAQFQLYRSVGFPASIVVCDHPLGVRETVDTSRPRGMTPSCGHLLSQPCPTAGRENRPQSSPRCEPSIVPAPIKSAACVTADGRNNSSIPIRATFHAIDETATRLGYWP